MRALFAFAALFLAAAPATAQEVIRQFDSEIEVRKDGSIDVTEWIEANAEGSAIVHGLYRDLRTRYRLPRGGMMRTRFHFVDATRDGQPEPAKVESIGDGVRIRLGSADSEVPNGLHAWRLHYRIERAIGRFDGFDELYWNITGNGWRFPIERASATIALPSPAKFGDRAAYTGAYGAKGGAAEVRDESAGRISFATVEALAPGEGLTIAAAFPKGVIDAPSQVDESRWWLADNVPPMIGALGLLGVLGFLYWSWSKVGRDPRPGTVVPLFAPPEGLSPAAMRYIQTMKFDTRGFAATLVDLGVRGHVKLVEEESGWLSGAKRFVVRLPGGTDALAVPEQTALDALAMPSERIELDNANHEEFTAAKKAVGDDLKARFEGSMFHRNLGWAAAGLLVMLGAAWLGAASFDLAQGMEAGGIALGAVGAGVSAGLIFLVARGSGASGKCLFGFVAAVLGLIAVAASFPLVGMALAQGGFVPVLLPLLAAPFVALAFYLMPAPTAEGRKTLDRIAGFKQYLSIAEGERLDRMTGAPDANLQTFEKYLPYAIALGVENKWADRFRSQLAAAQAAGQAGGFAWYSGSHSPWTDVSGFTNDIGSSFASSLGSAGSAPGSSSGSGGGGFSGGGGGGGGGGGW